MRIERGKDKENSPEQFPAEFEFFVWWTRSQSIRTEGEAPFEAALTELAQPPSYRKISEDVKRLHQLGINPNRIAVLLKADRTTVVRALQAIECKPTCPDRGTR